MKTLTKRQREIVDFIEAYRLQHRYSPTYREIQSQFGFRSLGSVYNHIRALKQKGAVAQEPRARRSLSLPPEQEKAEASNGDVVQAPFIGFVSVGSPFEMIPQSQTIPVPKFMLSGREPIYVMGLRDACEGMALEDGDLLIIEPRQEASSGERVLAVLDEGTTLISRYYPEGSNVRLEGGSVDGQPMIFPQENLMIHGVIIGVFRLY